LLVEDQHFKCATGKGYGVNAPVEFCCCSASCECDETGSAGHERDPSRVLAGMNVPHCGATADGGIVCAVPLQVPPFWNSGMRQKISASQRRTQWEATFLSSADGAENLAITFHWVGPQ